MFYVSSLNNGMIGVMDTSDYVEEFYTHEDLVSLVTKYRVKIEGFIYTGSVWKARLKTEDILALEGMQAGDIFLLHLPDCKEEWVMYLGETGECNHRYLSSDGDTHVLTISFLVRNLGNVITSRKVDDWSKTKLEIVLRKTCPTLAMRLGL